MVDRFLKNLLPRLRFLLANPQPLPLLALGLLLAAGALQLAAMPAREAAIEQAAARQATLERQLRRQQIASQAAADGPLDARQQLLGRFPGEAGLNAELGRLLALAGERGLSLPEGEYRLVQAKDGLFDRYVLSLPVSGDYRAIRAYVQAVRSDFPALAVDDLSVRRAGIGAERIDAQIRLVLFARRLAP